MATTVSSEPAAPSTFAVDVLVVGGGTAGCMAALAACEEGARVCLLEAGGSLGGTGTAGGIHSYYYGTTGGLQDEIDDQVQALQEVFGGRTGGFHPEAKRAVLAQRLAGAGVQIIFDALVYEIVVEAGRVLGVRAATPTGDLTVLAHITIDSSGDGDVAAGAGADYTFGRSSDGISHQYSLVPRTLSYNARTGEPQIRSHNFDAGVVRPDDPWDVARALHVGRTWLWNYFAAERDGAEAGEVLAIASQLGVREGRHVGGEYVLTFDDYLHGRAFEDGITLTYSHYDNHARDLANEPDFCQVWLVALAMCRKGVYAQVPYRCLVPRGVGGLLIACRAISLDRETSMGIRMQRDMQKIGEAAGVAAAIAVAGKREPREISVAALQERLIARGVLDPAADREKLQQNFQFRDGPLHATRISTALLHNTAGAELAEHLTTYLGGDEQGTALWWLSQHGKPAIDALSHVLETADTYRVRRGAAFGLAMLGSERALPMLRECFARRDGECPPPEIKTYPRWIAALVFLRMLRDTGVLDEVLAELDQPHDASVDTFLLAYLHDIAPLLDGDQRGDVVRTLRAWIADPEHGASYAAQGSGVSRTHSIRWNVELWVARVLERCGDTTGRELAVPLRTDERPFVRDAAARIVEEHFSSTIEA